jgi:hypothetical protein
LNLWTRIIWLRIRTLVNMAINFRVLQVTGNVLSRLETLSFPRSLLHIVRLALQLITILIEVTYKI